MTNMWPKTMPTTYLKPSQAQIFDRRCADISINSFRRSGREGTSSGSVMDLGFARAGLA